MRTILLTGGSGKLGRVMIRHFLDRGDTVLTTSRDQGRLDDMASDLNGGDRFVGLVCDLAQPSASATLVAELTRRNLRPTCLINNARNIEFLKMEAGGRVSRENFAGEFLVDVIVPYELTMALAEQQDSRLQRVVNIGSQYGSVAASPQLYDDHKTQSPLHYGVCKAALAHLTKELAVRLAPSGILVNCIAFGGVEGRVDQAFKDRYAKLVPLGRMLRESEVVGPIDMLLKEELSGITGQTVAVDGGWTIW